MAHRTPIATALAVMLAIVIATPAWAAAPTEVLQTFVERANAVLRAADLERGIEAPRRAIRALVNEIFDYQDAAARALGPAWQSRTPGQRAEFVRLFADLVERGYFAFISSKVNVTDGLTISFVEESVSGDAAAVATTLLTRNGSDLDVDYIMLRRGERWLVRDVIVDGMSLVANYRAQFTRILTTSSYGELVARMQGEALEPPQAVLAAAAPAATRVASAPVAPVSTPAAPAPVLPVSTPAVVPPPVVAPPAAAKEVQVGARPRDEAPQPMKTIRVSVPEPSVPAKVALTGGGRTGATRYWIQVGAFRTESAALHLAERLRREGMDASNEKLASVPWHPAGALARVRVGPFATHSDARLKLRELMAHGFTPFIAEDRD